MSLVEASAMGLPVISTRHSAIPEVVLDGETGYLVAEHDIVAMGRRIAEIGARLVSLDAPGQGWPAARGAVFLAAGGDGRGPLTPAGGRELSLSSTGIGRRGRSDLSPRMNSKGPTTG